MLRKEWFALLLTCLAWTGCAGGLGTKPRGWAEISTQHIRLRTDLDADAATDFVRQLEAHRAALASAAFECATEELTEPIAITLFSRVADYDAIAPRDTDAIVEASRPGLAEIPPEIVMKRTKERKVLLQEFLNRVAHSFIAQCYPQLPPWLNEGLALFYETIELDNGQVIAGAQKFTFVPESELPNERSRRPKAITVVPEKVVPPLTTLLNSEFEAFYQYTGHYDTLREREQLRMTARYAGAWALTHALETADISTRARLQRFMLEVRFGDVSMADAWRRTMKGVHLQKLYAEWTAIQTRYPVIAIPYEHSTPREPRVRKMSEAEVDAHLAARWDWSTEKGRSRAESRLARAIELAPDRASFRLVAAALAQASGATERAAEALSTAIRLAPDDAEVMRSELVFRTESLAGRLPDTRTNEELAAELEAKATTASEYDALAQYYLQLENEVMEARYWAARAIRRNPSCAVCRVTAGAVLEAAGQPVLAQSMYRRALNLAAHDAGFDRAAVLAAIARLEPAEAAPAAPEEGERPARPGS